MIPRSGIQVFYDRLARRFAMLARDSGSGAANSGKVTRSTSAARPATEDVDEQSPRLLYKQQLQSVFEFAQKHGQVDAAVSLLNAGIPVKYLQSILATGHVETALALFAQGIPPKNIQALLTSMPRPLRRGILYQQMAAVTPPNLGFPPSEALRVACGATGDPSAPGAQAAAMIAAYERAIGTPTHNQPPGNSR
jgi:hypothetical protein